jgi:hypothetical protein
MVTSSPSKSAILLARVAVALLFGLVVAGIATYGISAEELERFRQNIVARPGGPMMFRFVLQPAMASLAALRDGINDARRGRSPYVFAVIRDADGRGGLLWEGVVATAKILILGVAMDLFYQFYFFETFHPAEAAKIAILLAFAPYFLMRGPINRIARRWVAQPSPNQSTSSSNRS